MTLPTTERHIVDHVATEAHTLRMRIAHMANTYEGLSHREILICKAALDQLTELQHMLAKHDNT